MADSTLPFFIDSKCVGSVIAVSPQTGFFRGRLELDTCPEHSVFSSVVALAAIVDTTSPEDYQAAWQNWHKACSDLLPLKLCIGNASTAVEEIGIESDWSIEWQNVDDDLAALGLSGP